jgi:hypothetical protein
VHRKKLTIEDGITALLAHSPVRSSQLVTRVSNETDHTIQAVYLVIRKMREAGIVLSHHGVLSLSTVWLEQQIALFEEARQAYLDSGTDSFSFGRLQERDRIAYEFKNPVLLDEMWGHLFMVLLKQVEISMPIMIYNAHSWFPIVRRNSEATIFTSLANQGYRAFFSIGGTTDLDRDVGNSFIKPLGHSFSLGNQFGLKNTQYMNIIGDYIIEVTLDTEVSDKIDAFYNDYSTLQAAEITELQTIVTKVGKNKLVVSRNTQKAQKWRSRLAKNFLIPTTSRRYV